MIIIQLLASPALACGGFFCDAAQPIVQEAERIVFAVDEVAQVVETHVQVEYAGPPSEFAWIVPVQAEPELFITSDLLFSTVAQQLQPVFAMQFEFEGNCSDRFRLPRVGRADLALAAGVAEDSGANGVDVVGQAQVGPYDTVTLQAESIEALTAWLNANDYAIPSNAADAIAPYVSADGYFVALKLAAGADAGDLRPLGLRYAGTTPAIPIQLTAVAAAPDLRLEVTVFGSRRAVPKSYLHVEINDAAIDWFDQGRNYPDVITRAADEAGGNAFATDYAGTSELLSFQTAWVDYSTMETASSPTDWIQRLQNQGLFADTDLLNFFSAVLPTRSGLDPVDVYNCPSCYTDWYVGPAWDAKAVTDRLAEEIVEPRLRLADFTQKYPYVTRMTSSISAAEMTVDPTFVFNDSMGDVDSFRSATLTYECGGITYRRRADRRFRFPDGREVDLPSERWFERKDITESEYLAGLGESSVSIIERTGEGPPELLTDLREQLATEALDFERSGCGCQTTAPALSWASFGLLGLLALRRRR